MTRRRSVLKEFFAFIQVLMMNQAIVVFLFLIKLVRTYFHAVPLTLRVRRYMQHYLKLKMEGRFVLMEVTVSLIRTAVKGWKVQGE